MLDSSLLEGGIRACYFLDPFFNRGGEGKKGHLVGRIPQNLKKKYFDGGIQCFIKKSGLDHFIKNVFLPVKFHMLSHVVEKFST